MILRATIRQSGVYANNCAALSTSEQTNSQLSVLSKSMPTAEYPLKSASSDTPPCAGNMRWGRSDGNGTADTTWLGLDSLSTEIDVVG